MGKGDFKEKNHKVKVSSFYIGKCEVTQSQYKKLMGHNQSYFKGIDLPVTNISWFDAIIYCNKLSKKEGLSVAYNENTGELIDKYGNVTIDTTKVEGYRLPTEAEWEFAARGGNKSEGYKYSGSNRINDVAWYRKNSFEGKYGSKDYGIHAVGGKQPNELGIYDMSGNVSEICQDWYVRKTYRKHNSLNPYVYEPENVSGNLPFLRVGRGGSWDEEADNCRVDSRAGGYPDSGNHNGGFRICRSFFR